MQLKGTDLAKLMKVARQHIYVNVSRGNLVKNNKNLYDTDDPINKEYLLNHGVSKKDIDNYVLSKSEKKTKKVKKEKPSQEKIEKKSEIVSNVDEEVSEEDIIDKAGLPEEMLSLTIYELVSRYGGQYKLEKWASILQKLTTSQKTQVAIERDRLKLIEKDFIISQCFKFVDEFINKILDSIDAQNEIIFSLAKSGDDEAKIKIKKMMIDNYSKLAKQTKTIITNNIQNMKDKYAK